MSCDLAPMGEVILHMPSTDNDSFAKKLEFEVLESRFGYSRVKGRVKPEFLNGLGIAHGGYLFSMADFALALASNTDERSAVSASASVDYKSPCPAGAEITAEAKCTFSDEKGAIFDVRVFGESSERPFMIFQARAIFKRKK